MPRTCTICHHAQRREIDEALLASESLRNVAKRTGTSFTALHRHKKSHIPQKLAKAKEAEEVVESDSLLERLRQLNRETQDVLRAARDGGNHDLRLKAINRVEKQLELEGKLLGELNDGASTQINVQVLAPIILEALTAFPEARQAVAGRLLQLEQPAK